MTKMNGPETITVQKGNAMSLHIDTRALPRNCESQHITLGRMLAVYRQRRALLRLDATALADLGLSRLEALREAKRPFWDLP